LPQKQPEIIFCGSKSFQKNHFQMEMVFFLTGNAHFQNVGNHFCENHFQCFATKKHFLVAACGE
jgi:hypothetical protein